MTEDERKKLIFKVVEYGHRKALYGMNDGFGDKQAAEIENQKAKDLFTDIKRMLGYE